MSDDPARFSAWHELPPTWVSKEDRPQTVFGVSPEAYQWCVLIVNEYASGGDHWVTTVSLDHARWILDHVANGTAIIRLVE